MEEKKVNVGLTWAKENGLNDIDYKVYAESIKAANGNPIYLEEATTLEIAKENLKKIDCIVIAGGEDINPKLYGEKMKPTCEKVFDVRDISDFNYVKAAIELDMPLMATCRGMQVLNVVCGGTLYQDIFTEYPVTVSHRDPAVKNFTNHTIEVDDNNIMADALGGKGVHMVNSWHHQAVKEVGNDLVVVAKADDGIIEGIVHTKNKYCYGVQFHPEWYILDGDKTFIPMFEKLIEATK